MDQSFEIEPGLDGAPHPPSPEPSTKKASPVWSGWDILLLFFFTGFSALLMGSLSGAISHLLQIKFPTLQLLRHPASEGLFLLLFQGVLDLLILMFIYLTITLKYNSPFLPSIKWVQRGNTHIWAYPPLGVLLALTVLSASALWPSSSKPPIEELLKYRTTALMFAALGVFVAPFVEEVIFRGFIYPVVERRCGKLSAVIVTAMLFTTVHLGQLWGSWVGIILILLVGFTLSTVRSATDSLIPSFAIHLSYNATICLLFLITSVVKGSPA
jgi:membrane protease YdiL (CAAX protease family)